MNRLVALSAAAAISVAGCSSEESEPVGLVNTTVAGPTTTASPKVTTGEATATRDQGMPTQQEASGALVEAWKAGDRSAAVRVADAAAVDALFRVAFESEAAAPEFQACDANPGFENRDTCSYTYPGGSMHHVMKQVGDLWRVERVEYVAD